jgi:hypothetical protein
MNFGKQLAALQKAYVVTQQALIFGAGSSDVYANNNQTFQQEGQAQSGTVSGRFYVPVDRRRVGRFKVAIFDLKGRARPAPQLPALCLRRTRGNHGGDYLEQSDDASRVVTHAEFFYRDNTENMVTAFRSALYKRGKPERLYFDNGSNYSSKEIAQACVWAK